MHLATGAELHANSKKLQKRGTTNAEHEAEEKAKKDKWEAQFTMYLDKAAKGECVSRRAGLDCH
jgi:hypothetical protein